MSPLWLRLTALAAAAAAGALGAVALALAPAARTAVRDDALNGLMTTARTIAPDVRTAVLDGATAGQLQALVATRALDADARVTIVGAGDGHTAAATVPIADSRPAAGEPDLQFPVVADTIVARRPRTAVEAGRGGRIGQAAVPLSRHTGAPVGAVLVLSRPLPDDTAIVAAITRRLLWPALAVLLLATLAGLLAGRTLTRRITRLEHAARGVAAGRPGTPFPAGRHDEIGALARALEEMRVQLDELDGARRRFIATASHELRTPLFSLGGFLELIEDDDVPEADRRRFVTQLRSQVRRLEQLATDLLDLSKLESGGLELNERATDLRDLAREVASEFEPRVAAHGAHIELRLADTALNARCDPERVLQVLRILVDNALAHTPAGTDMVIAASRRDGRLRLSVADYGPGIGRTVLPTIFEPFATTDDTQGTGLGLAIARELATRMSGELRVESRAGLTRFTLDLEPASA